MPEPQNWIVHLCARPEWEAAQAQGEYRAASLAAEGFMHCSRPEQIAPVANRFYRGRRGQVLLWIDPQRLHSEVRWESADGEVFPHLYGPLNLEAVQAVTPFEPDEGGRFSPPRYPGAPAQVV